MHLIVTALKKNPHLRSSS
jgi:hypothetical protein